MVASGPKKSSRTAMATLVSGVKMIENQLMSVFKRLGAVPFNSVGSTFDPERHEAVQTLPHAEIEEGGICQELQRGFTFHDRLLRPARVIVSAGAPTSEA